MLTQQAGIEGEGYDGRRGRFAQIEGKTGVPAVEGIAYHESEERREGIRSTHEF